MTFSNVFTRFAEAGIEASVDSVGHSCDNVLTETVNSLFRTEVIRQRGLWKTIENVEYATIEGVSRFAHRRLLEPIANVPPAEHLPHYDPASNTRVMIL